MAILEAVSLFAGYGGLTLAIEETFGAQLVAYSEFDAAPSAVMAHHWPDAPNLGDITQIDWTQTDRAPNCCAGPPE